MNTKEKPVDFNETLEKYKEFSALADIIKRELDGDDFSPEVVEKMSETEQNARTDRHNILPNHLEHITNFQTSLITDSSKYVFGERSKHDGIDINNFPYDVSEMNRLWSLIENSPRKTNHMNFYVHNSEAMFDHNNIKKRREAVKKILDKDEKSKSQTTSAGDQARKKADQVRERIEQIRQTTKDL